MQKSIRIQLKYGANKQRVIVGLKRISRPGLRVYARKDEVPKVLNGLGRCHSLDVPRRDDRPRGPQTGRWRRGSRLHLVTN